MSSRHVRRLTIAPGRGEGRALRFVPSEVPCSPRSPRVPCAGPDQYPGPRTWPKNATARWGASFTELPRGLELRPLDESTARSWAGSGPGLQCGYSSSRLATQRARKHGTGADWAQVGHLKSIQSGATRNISSPLHTFRPPREASSGPKNLAGAVHALLPSESPIAHAAFTHGRGNPETHLELPHRFADHLEQPRRQRDQLGRELSVRPTWGDRRKRPPVPREQHRQEHIRPLQTRLVSFGHARFALPTVTGVPLLRTDPWPCTHTICDE